ncbi:hypothetical protein GN109_25740, partial [Collimonas pratensis]|nr:hypothetical protein [Collimonas pratensis]
MSRNTVRRYLRSEITGPSYADRYTPSASAEYVFQLLALLKTEAVKSCKQRRTLKQIHQDLRDLNFEGYYDRAAAFARVWRAGQIDRVNSASKRTNWIFVVSNFECSYLGLFKLNETAQSVLALTKFVSLFVFQ